MTILGTWRRAIIMPIWLLNNLYFLSILVLVLSPRSVRSCGGFACTLSLPVVQSGEAIVFAVNETTNHVEMHVQILYEGPSENFGWLLPVPAQPTLGTGSDALFKALFDTTVPTFQLDIRNDLAATCTNGELEPVFCMMQDNAGAMPEMGGGATVLDQGSVGPFDYVVLEAAPNDPSSILDWLDENEYQVPDNSDALLNFYALQNNVFVALKLKKDTPSGEITPVILSYDMPDMMGDNEQEASTSTSATTMVARRTAIACVPLQLTRIAATPNMPILVYVLGDARAVPLNYLELELDDARVDWVGCLGNPSCYDQDYRTRFDQAASQVANHSFVTEYAGPANVMATRIAIPLTRDDILAITSENQFFSEIRSVLPDIAMVSAIVNQYFPAERPSNWTLEVTDLAAELDAKVLQPAQAAQDLVDSYSYLTRLYARLSPELMTKDPFFTFQPDLPIVSNLHRANAIPLCENTSPSALLITVQDSSVPIRVPATLACNGWIPTDPTVVEQVPPMVGVYVDTNASLARQAVAWGFPDDTPVIVTRDDTTGTLDPVQVQAAMDFGDSLVPDQTIPELPVGGGTMPTSDSTGMPPVAMPSSSPTPASPIMADVTTAPDATTAANTEPTSSTDSATTTDAPTITPETATGSNNGSNTSSTTDAPKPASSSSAPQTYKDWTISLLLWMSGTTTISILYT